MRPSRFYIHYSTSGARRVYPLWKPVPKEGHIRYLSKKDWEVLTGPDFRHVMENGGITVTLRTQKVSAPGTLPLLSAALLTIVGLSYLLIVL